MVGVGGKSMLSHSYMHLNVAYLDLYHIKLHLEMSIVVLCLVPTSTCFI